MLGAAFIGSLSGTARPAETADVPAGKLVELSIATKGDLLEFTTQALGCPSGARVRLRFTNAARYVNFDHNWVLMRPGTFDAVLAAAEQAGVAAGWLPAHDADIVAATAQAHRGETVTVEFRAPPAGRYPYACTTPGHASSMWGVLTVVKP